jgi:hypothetical protein
VAHGIPEDVFDHARQVRVADHAARSEAVAEEMPLPLVLAVERLRVDAVHPVKRRRQSGLRRLDHQVVVVSEQRQRVDAPAVIVDRVTQEREKREAVAAVAEDRAAVDAFDPDVEDAVGEPSSERPCHGRPR